MTNAPAKQTGGFTLVELVLVIMVITVAMFPLSAMFYSAVQHSPTSTLFTQAAFLAQERMEEVLADYQSPSRGYGFVDNVNYPPLVSPAGFPGFTIAVNVSAEAIFDGVDYKQVDVNVAHTAVDTISMTMWVAEP